MQILVVEDNPADVLLIRDALETFGYSHELEVAADGDEAIEYVTHSGKHVGAQLPDLILLDLNLPKRSGVEVLQEIRRNSETRSVPVIIVSSVTAQAELLNKYGLHANGYVVKPPDPESFCETIRNITGRAKTDPPDDSHHFVTNTMYPSPA